MFTKSEASVHESTPAAIKALQKLGSDNQLEVVSSVNAEDFNDENLENYAAVIFLNTSGDILNYRQEAAFERYIQAGGGFVGIHSASATEYDWKWYRAMVGAYFNGHSEVRQARYKIRDKDSEATAFFTDSVWTRTDEIYNFKSLKTLADLKVLITIDESAYQDDQTGEIHPVSWYHEYDGGRSFYTAMGHTEESYKEEFFVNHLLGGIRYAIGENKELDYSKVHTQLPPDEDRFSKTQLSQGEFFEPLEMTILPDMDILIIQRRGEVLLYEHETGQVKQVGFLDVYYKTKGTGVNAEEGVLGLQKDPEYLKNHWVYIFYSPSEKSVNRLSRFVFENDSLDVTSEKIILEVDSDREICCHTGGSIAFGPDGLLYVSTGDNSTPFDEPGVPYVNSGFAPLNDIPGHEQYDALRSSGNTNDLRGKILRIRLHDDGTYSIPAGNLFPPGTEGTRPEIYTMGHRNPYRISIDQKTGYLYWGEVGPDASADSLDTRGPRGYDEVNQAREAGNFGWPNFIADNLPYHRFDYNTGVSGIPYDPSLPENDSKNNTGKKILPPAKPAFIWYPYSKSTEFPQLGTGGRNAMTGPVYYSDQYPAESALPSYYDGKLIIYDWVRGWMKAVSMTAEGDFMKLEPFAPGVKLNALIDMEVGPDGKIYLLEYGNGWFTQNEDSGLARIDFNGGNRPPVIAEFKATPTTGQLPLETEFKVEASDPDGDFIKYIWYPGNGETVVTDVPELTYSFKNPGEYVASVVVKDVSTAETRSDYLSIIAGNERPRVHIEIMGDKENYGVGETIEYKVTVEDDAEVDPGNLHISVDYVLGEDMAAISNGHQQAESVMSGKALARSLDCKTCHKENESSVGPSYSRIAEKYAGKSDAISYLVKKIAAGGSGVWGEVMMPAHPDLDKKDIRQISTWIMSMSNSKRGKISLPASGKIVPGKENAGKTMIINAVYTDHGGESTGALTGNKSRILKFKGSGYSKDM